MTSQIRKDTMSFASVFSSPRKAQQAHDSRVNNDYAKALASVLRFGISGVCGRSCPTFNQLVSDIEDHCKHHCDNHITEASLLQICRHFGELYNLKSEECARQDVRNVLSNQEFVLMFFAISSRDWQKFSSDLCENEAELAKKPVFTCSSTNRGDLENHAVILLKSVPNSVNVDGTDVICRTSWEGKSVGKLHLTGLKASFIHIRNDLRESCDRERWCWKNLDSDTRYEFKYNYTPEQRIAVTEVMSRKYSRKCTAAMLSAGASTVSADPKSQKYSQLLKALEGILVDLDANDVSELTRVIAALDTNDEVHSNQCKTALLHLVKGL